MGETSGSKHGRLYAYDPYLKNHGGGGWLPSIALGLPLVVVSMPSETGNSSKRA